MNKVPFIIILLIISNSFIFYDSTNANTLNESTTFLKSNNEEYDLVIISQESYLDILIPLIEHKNSRNVKTFLKTTDKIFEDFNGRDEPEQIKYFIKFAVEEFNISYVLLVGSFEQIPGRYTHIFFDEPFDYPTPEEWVFTSDFYYADVYDSSGGFSSWDSNGNNVFAEYHWYGNTDEIDLTPDVYVGRLACTSDEQASICVDKIINYENGKSWGQEWFTNLILIAGDGIPGDPEAVDESEYLQEFIINNMQGFIPIKLWASNGGLLDAYNINDAINEGAGFVFFNGHGMPYLWVTYMHETNIMVPPGYYRATHIDQLSNKEKLPIVISDACYHLQYDRYSDCFGWRFIVNPDGGAIAFIGGSDTDLAYAGTRIVETGIEKLGIKMSALYQDGIAFLGELWAKSIIEYQPQQGDIVDLLTIVQNHLFGDPSLQIADSSTPPIKPNPPEGVSSGKIRTVYEFTAKTTDPDVDEIFYLFDWGDNTTGSWVGPFESGVSCTVSHSWNSKGNYLVKVKAKDTSGNQSPWSDPLEISMQKNKSSIYQWVADIVTIISELIKSV